MKIRVALIPCKHADVAEKLSNTLERAMERCEMKVVDQLTEELFSLCDGRYSLSLSEAYWHQFIKKVRSFDGDFNSDYIMKKPQLQTIIEAGIAENFADIGGIVGQALKIDGGVLQLPFEDKEPNV